MKAVILNDTRGHHHFGCYRVMRVIEENLQRRGIEVTARSLVRTNWQANTAFLDKAAAADVIVVNGEGTLHHASPHAAALLEIAEHPVRAGKPVVLLNALYQENPQGWQRRLDAVDLISVRDSRSFATLAPANAGKLYQSLDYSLAEGAMKLEADSPRPVLAIGESVKHKITDSLIAVAARVPGATFLPIVRTLKSSKPQYGRAMRLLREAYIYSMREKFRLRHRNSYFARDEFDYLDHIARAHLHVTGRFHAVCFSLISATPFLTFKSNSWKIETLMSDVGLDPNRMLELAEVTAQVRSGVRHDFSDGEKANLTAALAKNVTDTQRIFDQVAALAAGQRG